MKDPTVIADVVEFRVWASAKPCTIGDLKEELEAIMSESDGDPGVLAQNVMDEIQQRQILHEHGYPFHSDGYKIEMKTGTDSRTTYLFCLGLSLLPATKITLAQRTTQFETIAKIAAQSFFGGSALRIGVPLEGEFTSYAMLLKKISELLPNLGPPDLENAPESGDCGWDVLVVKSFRDGEAPRMIVLGNCATGRTDWLTKALETAPSYLFDRNFSNAHRSVVLSFFAIPFIMDEDARLRKNYGNVLAFDRFRICEHAPTASEDVAEWLETTREAALAIALG